MTYSFKIKNLISCFLILMTTPFIYAQQSIITPDLTNIEDTQVWTVHNRNVSYNQGVYLDSQPGDGVVRLEDLNFTNGTIKVDIRGKDVQGQSFVGIAFHGVNDSTYEAVYFRPFNFKNSDRKAHAVQ